MNGDWVISTTVGGLLVLAGALLMRWHVRSWRVQKNDDSLEDADRRYYYLQYRRRMQASGLIALLGILIPVCELLPAFKNQPNLWALYMISLLLLALWVIFLGFGDLFSTAAHGRSAMARIREKQRRLERQLEEIKARRSNGHKSDEG